jgi:hypothetical protein
VAELSDVEELLSKFNINFLAIDAQPETKLVSGFARQHFGRSAICYYTESHINPIATRPAPPDVHLTVNRTLFMDFVQERYRQQTVTVPYNVGDEFVTHMQAPTRIYGKDRAGNAVGRYDSCEKPDHYYHSLVYLEVALYLIVNAQLSKNING